MSLEEDIIVTVMTFNIWKWSDGLPAQWPQRKAAFVGCLRNLQPDVICVQEVGEGRCMNLD